MNKKSCGIFWNIAPLYSRPLWYELNKSGEIEFVFYSGDKGFSGIKTIDPNESVYAGEGGTLKWVFLRNIVIRNILLFQIGIIRKCITTNHDAYVLPGEMYTLSNWIAAIVCRLRNKPLFFWGHGLYGNENFIKKFVRITYYRLADFHFVYNNRSRDLMTISGISAHKIHVVYNSLDYSRHDEIYRKKDPESIKTIKERLFPTKGNLPMITFIGRLTREKKVHYLIEAIDLCRKKGHVYNCLIVGKGAEVNNLRNLVSRLRLNEQFVFYGSSYKEETNAGFIMASDCTVSPGNIGLTAIHSLALGTPVITHDNLNTQGPESEAVIQNKTGLLFIENDVMSLSDTIDDMILNERKRFMESSCTEEIKNKWNPSNQTGIIVKAILSQKNL